MAKDPLSQPCWGKNKNSYSIPGSKSILSDMYSRSQTLERPEASILGSNWMPSKIPQHTQSHELLPSLHWPVVADEIVISDIFWLFLGCGCVESEDVSEVRDKRSHKIMCCLPVAEKLRMLSHASSHLSNYWEQTLPATKPHSMKHYTLSYLPGKWSGLDNWHPTPLFEPRKLRKHSSWAATLYWLYWACWLYSTCLPTWSPLCSSSKKTWPKSGWPQGHGRP